MKIGEPTTLELGSANGTTVKVLYGHLPTKQLYNSMKMVWKQVLKKDSSCYSNKCGGLNVKATITVEKVSHTDMLYRHTGYT